MEVMCSYYNNSRRMGLVLGKLCTRGDVWLYPVHGTIMHTAQGVSCLGVVQEVLLVSKEGSTPLLFTTVEKYQGLDKKTIEYNPGEHDTSYSQALMLCNEKTRISGNMFTMDCAVNGATVVAHGSTDGTTYQVKSTRGDCQLIESDIPRSLCIECKGIKSFTYDINTETCERQVTVKRGQLEVFREVSHFLGKALVFTKLNDQLRPMRKCVVMAHGCCEEIFSNGVSRVVKVPLTKMNLDLTSAVTAVDATLDSFLRARSIAEAKLT